MPGTASNYIRTKNKYRYHSMRPMFINTHTTHYDNPRYDKPHYTKADKCLDACCTIIVIFALLMIPVAIIGDYAIKEENRLNKEYFINNFTIPIDNQSFDNPNYKCDLTYLDKCNHNDEADMILKYVNLNIIWILTLIDHKMKMVFGDILILHKIVIHWRLLWKETSILLRLLVI